MSHTMTLPLESLGPDFSDPVEPADFPKTILRYRNDRAAMSVHLEQLSDEDWVKHFGRFEPLPGNMERPRAIRYHGHQFRSYNPQIGDGRGFLFAQLQDDQGRLLDLGTKGSGQTPYSRTGDGRLTLKGGVREILATEMLEASGVPTSKTFSLIETGEQLVRNDEPSPTRSSVMVRLSHSHVRFGAFQRLTFLREFDNLAILLNHVREVYHPDIPEAAPEDLAPQILQRIATRTANMVASWMAAGFVHGVMNTDNMNVTGETFDFGPYRFLPTSDPKFTAAYFDEYGLYAFGRQPQAAMWNIQQLGSALTPLASVEDLTDAANAFSSAYQLSLRKHCFFQLGIEQGDLESDLNFLEGFFGWMTDTDAPWHQVFFDWFGGKKSETRAADSPISNLYSTDAFENVRSFLIAASPDRPERLDHPYFARQKPETLLIDEIEHLWADIADEDDWSLFHAKLDGVAMKREALGTGPL